MDILDMIISVYEIYEIVIDLMEINVKIKFLIQIYEIISFESALACSLLYLCACTKIDSLFDVCVRRMFEDRYVPDNRLKSPHPPLGVRIPRSLFVCRERAANKSC